MYMYAHIDHHRPSMWTVSSLPMQTIKFIVQTWWHGALLQQINNVDSFVHRGAPRLNDDSMNQQSAEFIPYILQNNI